MRRDMWLELWSTPRASDECTCLAPLGVLTTLFLTDWNASHSCYTVTADYSCEVGSQLSEPV